MRIVQTFWTAGRNPLVHSFGWLRPEYNLMSWALSCLSLREHYNELALYTDQHGKHILIDLLHLPYTEVHVVYDEHLCLPQHWAYAKIKTCSLQTKPFLHIDGDVYLPKPLSEEIMAALLVAQSKEVGTQYYRQMVDKLLGESSLKLPEYLEEALREESIASYNMGVFGGNDLSFIQAFCHEALAICETNMAACQNGNFNLLFEQILFASLAEREKIPVSTVCPSIYNDNGYTAGEFCQLYYYEHKNYFHLLGGHKRNQEITESLEETLLTLYPEHYKTIVSLFPHLRQRGQAKETACLLMMNTDMPVKMYIDFLNRAEKDWGKLSWEDLLEVEQRRLEGKRLSFQKDKLNDVCVCCNPYLKSFDVPATWDEEAIQIMRKRLSMRENAPLERVAIVPTLTSKMRKEFALYELEWLILETLKGKTMRMSELLNSLLLRSEDMHTLWLNEIRVLLNEGLFIPYHNFINH